MRKQSEQEKQNAITQLREWIKPGDTVYTILDHVSRSGMQRAIRVVLLSCENGRPVDLHPNYAIGKALGLRHWRRNGREQDALIVDGCGMDMGFHLVYELSHLLYGGRRCDCYAWTLNGRRYTEAEYHAREDRGRVSDGWRYLPDVACPICHGSGDDPAHGYRCLGKGKCPSNYHVNHHDTIRCTGTYDSTGDSETGEYCIWERDKGWILPSTGELCPTCNGQGRVPNPEGPERFDLFHTDGYALRHRWL